MLEFLLVIWFGKDKGVLTRRISRILKNQFDGLYTSWTKVPLDRQRIYFVEFAQTHHWDLDLTDQVRVEFEIVCLRRLKGMTKRAKNRSKTASKARNSDRKGLGPHQHLSGQKSYTQSQVEMKELGRPVTFGEVFLKTHTWPNGTFVDEKVKEVGATYKEKLQARLSEADMELSETEDGSPKLSIDEQNAIFLQCTPLDARGNPFGLGSLKKTLVNGRQLTGVAAAFVSIQQQLEAAQERLKNKLPKVLPKVIARILAEQQGNNDLLDLLSTIICQKNPKFSLLHKYNELRSPLSSNELSVSKQIYFSKSIYVLRLMPFLLLVCNDLTYVFYFGFNLFLILVCNDLTYVFYFGFSPFGV